MIWPFDRAPTPSRKRALQSRRSVGNADRSFRSDQNRRRCWDLIADETLMANWQRGDENALAALLSRYERKLWVFLHRLTGDKSTAEDLLQETFMRLLQHGSDWQPSARFSTWIYTVARNLAFDHARRMGVRKARSLDESNGSDDDHESRPALMNRIPGDDRGGERAALDGELRARVDAALASLPIEQREVFLMREVMDLSFAEIAETTNTALPTVKSRMRYALERLQGALKDLRDSGLMRSVPDESEATS